MHAMRRILLIWILASLVAEPALAASLSATSNTVGAGTASTPRCTATGLGVVPNFSGANVASVTVSGIPAGCGNATLQAAVNNGSANSTGSTTVPAGGGSVTVTLAVAVALTAGTEMDVMVVGP
jgi:hypothetical protein